MSMKEIADKIERSVKTYCGGVPNYVEMTDIVERLTDALPSSADIWEAKREIESLRQQLADLKAEMKMDAEGPDWIQRAMQAEASEDVLKQQLAECQAERFELGNNITIVAAVLAERNVVIKDFAQIERGMEQALAECQARERAIREAAIEVAACTTPINRNGELARLKKAMPLIIQPQDSTALDTLKRQWQREALLEAIEMSKRYEWDTCYIRELRRMAKELE
jgi:hypothetical protein